MTVLPHGAESSHTFSLLTLAPGSVFPTSSAQDALPWLCHHVPPDYHYLIRNFKAATLTHSEVTPSLESFLLFDNQGSLLPAQGFITTPTLSSELLVDGNLIDNLGYPPISLLVRQVDAAVLAEPQEVYIPVGILSAFRSLGFCSKSVPSCMDDRQLLAHYTTPARLVESMDSSWSLVTSGMSRHEWGGFLLCKHPGLSTYENLGVFSRMMIIHWRNCHFPTRLPLYLRQRLFTSS
ncbi:hypothetical protein F5141DRAFT_661872 [Pisolithus sp. B1]|nr:hypothetical protein F5141DRAFT_661872 [Pisolithus sp. B1]